MSHISIQFEYLVKMNVAKNKRVLKENIKYVKYKFIQIRVKNIHKGIEIHLQK